MEEEKMNKEMMDRKKRGRLISLLVLLGFIGFIALITFSFVSAADPEGPTSVSVVSNETKGVVSTKMINISGGRIATLNLNATIQNVRWKAFVGNVTGKFTLDDSSGSTIYDWTLSSITGRIYATRNSSSVTWGSINCSNVTTLERENIYMNHSNSLDNLTATFNASAGATHGAFYVGSKYISANTCPTLNVYRNGARNDLYWEEMALYDSTNIVYAAIIDDDETGFDAGAYDFQMIVPENGLPSFTGATAYYLYIELGN